MTAEIVSLADRRPHMTGEVVCMECEHRWTSVAPTGTATLECPECSCTKGVWRHPSYPPRDALIFVCNCGNDLFILRPEGPWCVRCATWVDPGF